MCLVTNNPTPKVANKPIRVWKVLRIFKDEDSENTIKYCTPYLNVSVNIGETLRAAGSSQKLKLYRNTNFSIVQGQGVHAFISIKHALLEEYFINHGIVTEWEIPTGAKYWIGIGPWHGQIAATEMNFIKIL